MRWLVLFVCAAIAVPTLAVGAARDVSIPGGKAPLFGTFEDAGGRAVRGPAVLILAGSGPVDRDGNAAAGYAPNELKQVADALAAAGIASLRVDKRGVAASAPAAPAEAELRLSTYVDDAVAWASWLRDQPGVRCVVLVGHSEGALIATLAAQKTRVCGLVSLEGAGRPLKDVLRDQIQRKLPDPLRSQALDALDTLASGKLVADPPPQLATLFRPSVQPYWISELSIDPAAEIGKVHAPALLVQGGADQQVSVADFERLKAARPDAQTLLVEGMVHPLKVIAREGPSSLVNAPLAPGLSAALVRFVKQLPD